MLIEGSAKPHHPDEAVGHIGNSKPPMQATPPALAHSIGHIRTGRGQSHSPPDKLVAPPLPQTYGGSQNA